MFETKELQTYLEMKRDLDQIDHPIFKTVHAWLKKNLSKEKNSSSLINHSMFSQIQSVFLEDTRQS